MGDRVGGRGGIHEEEEIWVRVQRWGRGRGSGSAVWDLGGVIGRGGGWGAVAWQYLHLPRTWDRRCLAFRWKDKGGQFGKEGW